MNEQTRELYLDLLTKKAITGLDDAETKQFDELNTIGLNDDFGSLEIAAAAVAMASIDTNEPLPQHLYSKIAAEAEQYLGEADDTEESPSPVFTADDVFSRPRKSSWSAWLGWAVAAGACIALAVNLWSTRTQPPPEVAQVQPTQSPAILTPAESREALMRSDPSMVKAEWAAGNVKDMAISGDVVWSDAKQAGYMRFRGLPPNDPRRETYQLWIFDKTQDKATPIDGGTFDVNSDGEVIVPINAKLKAKDPEMFAITMEKPGGVVVSKREKLAAIAKVETRTS